MKIRNNINELSPEFFDHHDTEEPLPKRRPTRDPNENMELVRKAKEVCDVIIYQAKERFGFTGHLIAAGLFFSENFDRYSKSFPVKKFEETNKAYPFFN